MATNFRLMTDARAEALPTASSASALDSLLNEYRTLATSEREKGAMFEELTRQFLLHDARFAHQFKEVYLWSEWPERQTGDTDIDLVAIPADENAGQAQEPRFGRGLRRGSRADASPGPHRPEHAPAPGQARRTGCSGL